MQLLTGHTKPVAALALAPDGSRLFSVARGQRAIWQWDLSAGSVARKLEGGHRDAIDALAVTPDGKHLLSASGETGVVAWPLDGGERRTMELPTGHRMHCGSVAIDGP